MTTIERFKNGLISYAFVVLSILLWIITIGVCSWGTMLTIYQTFVAVNILLALLTLVLTIAAGVALAKFAIWSWDQSA